MKLTDHQLRELIARQAGQEHELDPDLLRRAARDELSDDERERLIDALTEDPAAAEDYRLVHALERGAARSRPRFARAPFALAAVLVLGIGAGLYVGLAPEPVPEDSLRGASAVHPPDGALLHEPPARLAWPSVPGALRYQVVIAAANGEEVWRSGWVTESEVVLPVGVRAAIQGGHTMTWSAAADAEENRALAARYRFSVRP